MATRKTLDFLPKIFQTDTNRKFLSATLDQLVSEPEYTRLNGYVGRKFAPTYKTTDTYITEPDADRQNYQLEPSIVIKNSQNQVEFYSSYTDLLNKISYYGGIVDNHDRLFGSDYYAYNGLFDLDKFVNFSQYYWLPNGPDEVLIESVFAPTQATYTLQRDTADNCYRIEGRNNLNPEIALVRGGLYKFALNQPGHRFYIQTEPGISGRHRAVPAISSREVYGVRNNGQDTGQIEFLVPTKQDQDVYLRMPIMPAVDYVIDIKFYDVDGHTWEELVNNYGGFDGLDIDPAGKAVIFSTVSDSDSDWKRSDDTVIDPVFRRGVWFIRNQNGTIELEYLRDIPDNHRVYARLGKTHANREFYKNTDGKLYPVPVLTAQLDTLYYQDENDPALFGKIRLLDSGIDTVNVTENIIGKSAYTSPTGIDFTNGLVVRFDDNVQPESYAGKRYVVEGVGSSISLVDFENLVFPESGIEIASAPWDYTGFEADLYDESAMGPTLPDYITISRASADLNPWSRQNRWFHIDVIVRSAQLNGTTATFDQTIRAKRPIIEFEPGIQLYNFGRRGHSPVAHIDTTVTDSFNQVQHNSRLRLGSYTLRVGQRVLFANDQDPLVKTQIYRVEYKIYDEPAYKDYYDQPGTGTIGIEKPSLIYSADTNPVLDTGADDYTYTWTVRSTKSDLTEATVIEGLSIIDDNIVGNIVSVSRNGDANFDIIFTTSELITVFDRRRIRIRGTGGIRVVTGTDTKFATEIEEGSELATAAGLSIGTVRAILSDTKIILETPSPYAISDVSYKYKEPKIQLVVSDDPDDILSEGDVVVATDGANKGRSYWFDGVDWKLAQIKNRRNQAPLFDIFDNNDQSFSNYSSSEFKGSRIFSYKVGSGAVDPVLGFPVVYSTAFGGAGSIVSEITFDNNFGTDSFRYYQGSSALTQRVDTGYIRVNTDQNSYEKKSTWTKINEPSKQYQIISGTFNGTTNYYEIDIDPDTVDHSRNIKVFLNNNLLLENNYSIAIVSNRHTVRVNIALLSIGDKIDILIYSKKSVSDLGYYQIPTNLDLNSKNQDIQTLTIGQIRNNLISISQNIPALIGTVPGESNLRDIDYRKYSGNILQNSAPLIYPSLFLINDQANFFSAVEFAKKEYTKFKNKFLEQCLILPGIDPANPKEGVDLILKNINEVKNKNFAWYYSDMVPYSQATVTQYRVLNTRQRLYRITAIFDDRQVQNRAVLVYLNDRQLFKGIDFNFEYDKPGITLGDHIVVMANDTIEIRDYASTDGNFIPETPTKLGLYPKFLPRIFVDNTYRVENRDIEVLQGHDGSLTPTFNDHRDQFLLELESRIYNNIKIDYRKPHLDIRHFVPGRFRDNDYSLKEFNSIITGQFLKWIGSNRVDYTNNQWFANSDPFSYNYRNSTDLVFQEAVPGYWRAIYRYFYDTDRPHQCPWEMLGLTEKPQWWDHEYGPAPYTSGNSILWTDLENGLVRQGPQAGIRREYRRPGLSTIIPVNEVGQLLPPLGKLISKFNSAEVDMPFSVGDGGPAESAWQKTSEYPYALQIAVALMKPALYFGTLIDLENYYYNKDFDQYLVKGTKTCIRPTDVVINGEINSTKTQRARSYLNWIADYITNLGINGPNKIRSLLDNCQVQLSYKTAGFTDKKFVSVLAEQYSPSSINDSIIIPDDNYDVYLNKSVPVERVAYSAVIIERTGSGFTVSGYNTNNPYFIIVPSVTTGESYTITVGTISANIYDNYRKEKLIVPYGTVFQSRQQVVDFLISYQRYLFAQGFVFDEFNYDLNSVQDWVLSAKEFLTWTLQGWRAGNIIVLSPVSTRLNLISFNSVVDKITNDVNGSKLLDPNYSVIRNNEIGIVREDNEFVVQTLSGKTIAFAELNLVQYEHVLIFDNTTVFKDVIYRPESGSRQYRLKIVGNKTANWNGSLSPAGFVYNSGTVAEWMSGVDYKKGDLVSFKNQYYVATQSVAATTQFDINYFKLIEKSSIKTGLLPNFSNSARKFIDVYDVDSSLLDEQIEKMSNGLIGYRPRDYLTNLNVNNSSQVKFYQGFIRDKGTLNSVLSLANTEFNTLKNQVQIHEEWAVRVGEYGATNSNATVEILLKDSSTQTNPLGIVLVGPGDAQVEGFVNITEQEIYNSTTDQRPVRFLNRLDQDTYEADLENGGYVNIDDIDFPLLNASDAETIASDIDNIKSGYTIWIANDVNNSWNVYRVSETETAITGMRYGLDNTATVIVERRHGLRLGETIIVKNFDSQFDGLYTVVNIIDDLQFGVRITTEKTVLLKTAPVFNTGLLFVLDSVRFTEPSEIARFSPPHGWKNGDLVWVDKDVNQKWSVYEKNSPWTYSGILDTAGGESRVQSRYGTSVRLRADQQLAVVGSPSSNSGRGRISVYAGDNLRRENLIIDDIELSGIGQSIAVSQNYIFAGAPDSYAGRGAVLVYKVNNLFSYNTSQLLRIADLPTNSQFGMDITVSDDNKYLYVSSPGDNSVHLYELITVESRTDQYELFVARNGIVLPYTVTDPEIFSVSIRGKFAVLGINYTFDIATNKLTIIDATTISFAAEGEGGGFFAPEDENLTFAAETEYFSNGIVTVTRRSYYSYKNTATGENYADRFGTSIQTSADGSTLIVGAPLATVSSSGAVTQAGKTYVYANTRAVVPELRKLQTIENKDPVYQARFGTSVAVCRNSCSLYIGSPGYSDLDYRGGQVYRYLDTGRYYGRIQGTAANPTVTANHSVIINGVTVTFTGGNIQTVVNNINSTNIVGIRAKVENNKLTLTSNIGTAYNKLSVLPGVGTAYDNLGLQPFEFMQLIKKPLKTDTDNFGQRVTLDPTSQILAVSSTSGTAKTRAQVDQETTTFDSGSTVFIDVTVGTGSVYVYDYLSGSTTADKLDGSFVFGDSFTAPALQLGDRFGSGVAIGARTMLIGAEANDAYSLDSGNVYKFANSTEKNFWQQIRHADNIVDVSAINSVSLYNSITKSKLSNLDYIDPNKNKCLGAAEENINYKSSHDPAMYNAGLSYNSQTVDFHWGADQVGQTWWDLSAAKFLDYEQSSLSYRLSNWGKLFPGSAVRVYEWFASDVVPSLHVAQGLEGIPLYGDNSAYVVVTSADSNSGIIKSKYYYWVRGRTTVNTDQTRRISVVAIENIIADPKAQGIPYAAFLSDRSVALFNCDNYLKSDGTILKIDYDVAANSNLIHSEFQLIQEDNKNSAVPTRIIDKLIDSIAGIDRAQRRVPDPKLSLNRQLGLEIRPRQTLIQDRYAALNNLVDYANSVLQTTLSAFKIQNVRPFNQAYLFARDAEPAATEYQDRVQTVEELSYVYKVPGKRVLVVTDANYGNIWTIYTVTPNLKFKLTRNQTFDTTDLWSYSTWYADDFDPLSIVNYTVDFYNQIQELDIQAGDVVKVRNNDISGYEIYKFTSNSSSDLVGVEKGSLKIDSSIYNIESNNIGYDNNLYEKVSYDKDIGVELRNLVSGLLQEVFVDDLAEYCNRSLFVLLKYILSEQQNIDWLFKTSFVSILHNIKDLYTYPNISKDNQDYCRDYISEVKPYKTKIRDYKLAYTGFDSVAAGMTDFDLPGYWDSELGRYRSVSGEITKDSELYLEPENINYYDNQLFTVESIVISDAGSGYTANPQITIVSNNDNGQGATAVALINEITGKLLSITVTNPGKNYSNTPYVIINGNGTGARAYAQLKNNKIRSIKTVMKFDRITYRPEVVQWQANVAYTTGTMISHDGRGYMVKVDHTSSVFSLKNFTLIGDAEFNNAADRVAATYYPGEKQIPREVDSQGRIGVSRLLPGTTDEYNIVKTDDTVYNESVYKSPIAGQSNTGAEAIDVTGGQFYDTTKSFAPEELIPGTTLDSVSITVSTVVDELAYIYKIVQDTQGEPKYFAVSAENITELQQDLRYDDKKIYLNDFDRLTLPDVDRRIPGRIVINGEIIQFYHYNIFESYIKDPVRGVDGTAVPEVHMAGTTVVDQGDALRVPDTTVIKRDFFTYTADQPYFVTAFTVSSDSALTNNLLAIYNGYTRLTANVDYTVTVQSAPLGYKANISFVDADRFVDGIRFRAVYTEDQIWLNRGSTTVTDGTGFAGGTRSSIEFIKQFPHNLS